MSYIPYPVKSENDNHHPFYKRIVRASICGVLFAIPLSVAIPASPLLRLSQTQTNKKSLVPRMMTDFFFVNFLAAFSAYFVVSEYFITSDAAKEGFMPYLGPISAQIPAWNCLLASHMFYPGMWAVFNERTWKARRVEFVRLNTKCFFAFAPVHVPATIVLGLFAGVVLYPFKYMKQRKEGQSGEPTKVVT
ncbi:hypothetical protein, conserved [Angomonas deanei]|uniref:Uncharacterized protein n=1 Tax=Angomonas deanei TaxID=59799 RepID=A0A7G2CIE7_9TRYP|nr:hypothetical protein, conserved [Angomonas deanei]